MLSNESWTAIIGVVVIYIVYGLLFSGDDTIPDERRRNPASRVRAPDTSTQGIRSPTSPTMKANVNTENSGIVKKLANKYGINGVLRTITVSIKWNTLHAKYDWPIEDLEISDLNKIASNINTFMLVEINDNDMYEKPKLEALKIYNFIPNQRILFYTTDIGKLAILRQLEPAIHVEYDMKFIPKCAPFMNKIIKVVENSATTNNIINKNNSIIECNINNVFQL